MHLQARDKDLVHLCIQEATARTQLFH